MNKDQWVWSHHLFRLMFHYLNASVRSMQVAIHTPPWSSEDDYFVGGDCEDGAEDDEDGGHMTNGGGAGDGGEPMETGQFDDPEE